MTRNLVLVLSAFTSLIAVVTMVDGALLPAAGSMSRSWMLGVLVVDALCWLRWRWGWKHTLLVPSLLVGAAMLVSFAAVGIGNVVHVSAVGSEDAQPNGLMNVVLAAQGGVMFIQLWQERRGRRRITAPADQHTEGEREVRDADGPEEKTP